MKKIGTTKLWIGELLLPKGGYDTPQLQHEITEFVRTTRHTVTGAYLPGSDRLLLLHWPETRKGYVGQTIDDCEIMQHQLAKALQATEQGSYILPSGTLLCMMGLRIGGYTGDKRTADIAELAVFQDRIAMKPAHMISARARHDGTTESYGEPTVLLQGSDEAVIHQIGDHLQQHHYGIHRGSGTTDFYETKWATEN